MTATSAPSEWVFSHTGAKRANFKARKFSNPSFGKMSSSNFTLIWKSWKNCSFPRLPSCCLYETHFKIKKGHLGLRHGWIQTRSVTNFGCLKSPDCQLAGPYSMHSKPFVEQTNERKRDFCWFLTKLLSNFQRMTTVWSSLDLITQFAPIPKCPNNSPSKFWITQK